MSQFYPPPSKRLNDTPHDVRPFPYDPKTLTSLTAESFAVNVQAVTDMILEKDKNLNQETSRYWGEITDRTYTFDLSVRDAAAVQSLAMEDLLDFYDVNFSAEGAERRKFATWVYGNQFAMEEGKKIGAIRGGDSMESVAASGSPVESTPRDAADNSGDDSGSNAREVIFVEDCVDFKRAMPLLAMRKPTSVSALMVNSSKL